MISLIGGDSSRMEQSIPDNFANKDSIIDDSCAGWAAGHHSGSIQDSTNGKGLYYTSLENYAFSFLCIGM
jgi:hypothetical protein